MEQIKRMIDALMEYKVTLPITYPVRAGLASNDIDIIKTLLKNTTFSNATLTVWSSEGDPVNVVQLSKLIQDVGVDKVYVDVPQDLKNQLNLSSASTFSFLTNTITLGIALITQCLLKMLWDRNI